MRNVKLFLFFIGKNIGLFHISRWLTRNHLKILCYHGFALDDEAEFRPQLFIKSTKFELRLAVVRRHGHVVLPLEEGVERLYSGTLPKHAVVITVDDGFHSVHRVAAPILKRHKFPATVYLTTYYVDHPNPVFRLVVQYMFHKTRIRELLLKDVGWCSNRRVDLSDEALTRKTIRACIDFGERECTEEQRKAICVELGDLLETPYEKILQSRILHLMTPQELLSLDGTGIDVQLHTHRHHFPGDSRPGAEKEIADNRASIKKWLPGEKRHFCYPSGQWNPGQWSWLDDMNVKSSTTCLPGLNSRHTPRHTLRRFLDGQNIHQLEFEASLSGFSDLLRQFSSFLRSDQSI